MSNSTPPDTPVGEQASSAGSSEYLEKVVQLDFVPTWIREKDVFGVRPEKITGRDLIERVPKVGSEEAVAATTEALLNLVDLWPTLEGMTKGRGFWLKSIPPLLRELRCVDFSPRYPEMLEGMRCLRLSVKMSVGGSPPRNS